MPRLIVENGDEAGMVYPIRDEAVTIGRSASSTIQIVDKRVSRHHAVLRATRDAFVLEDLGSKNGTFLNDKPLVGRVRLNVGDKLQVGDSTFTFERDGMVEGSSGMGVAAFARAMADSTGAGGVVLVPDSMSEIREERRVEDSSSVNVARSAVMPEVIHDPVRRLQVLLQVAEILRGETEIDQLLRRIMDVLWNTVTPYRGIILLQDERDHTLEPVVVRTRDGETSEINISRGIVERALHEQVAILVSDAPSDVRFSSNDSVIAGRVRSAICAPLVHKGEVLGAIYIDSREPGSVYFTNDELDLMTGIANQAAMAIVNVRLHRLSIERQRLEKELEIARTIQMNLLPREYPKAAGLELSAMSLPARQVGGDYYDFLPLPDGRLALVVADVSGKGVPAAILTATMRASLRLETSQATSASVETIVGAINKWTCLDASNNMFVTMVYTVYDPESRRLTYCNAGHVFPLLFKASGELVTLERGGCFLGIMDLSNYECDSLDVDQGDTLILYTDGVTDAHDPEKQLFGHERLVEVIRANLLLSAEELRDEIYEATLVWRGTQEQFDDLTIVVAKF